MFFRKTQHILKDLEYKDLYKILGVEHGAPSGLIQHSFTKLLRRYPPDKYLDTYFALDRAYRTLMDPELRKRYDTLMSCGDDIKGLMNLTYAAIIGGQFKVAELHIKRIVAQTNESAESLILLAEIQYEQRKFKTSIETLQKLVDLYPKKTVYRNHMGDVLMALYYEFDDRKMKKDFIEKARNQYKKSIEIDDSDMSVYIALADTYCIEEDFETAYEWTEKAVNVEKLDKFRNFIPLLFGCRIRAIAGKVEGVRDQLRRLEDILPDANDETLNFATDLMIDTCLILLHAEKYASIRLIALSAVRIAPDRKELKRFLNESDTVVQIMQALKKLDRDPHIIIPVKQMAHSLFGYFFGKIDEETLHLAADEFEMRLRKWPNEEIRESFRRMQSEYRVLWNINPKFWDISLEVGTKRYLPWGIILALLYLIYRITTSAGDCGSQY